MKLILQFHAWALRHNYACKNNDNDWSTIKYRLKYHNNKMHFKSLHSLQTLNIYAISQRRTKLQNKAYWGARRTERHFIFNLNLSRQNVTNNVYVCTMQHFCHNKRHSRDKRGAHVVQRLIGLHGGEIHVLFVFV